MLLHALFKSSTTPFCTPREQAELLRTKEAKLVTIAPASMHWILGLQMFVKLNVQHYSTKVKIDLNQNCD